MLINLDNAEILTNLTKYIRFSNIDIFLKKKIKLLLKKEYRANRVINSKFRFIIYLL